MWLLNQADKSEGSLKQLHSAQQQGKEEKEKSQTVGVTGVQERVKRGRGIVCDWKKLSRK